MAGHQRRLLRKRRKKRKGEVNCTCSAYPFIHRQFGGNCDGTQWVDEFLSDGFQSECRHCNLRGQGYCEVQQGQESPIECPALQDHVAYHEIYLPMAWR